MADIIKALEAKQNEKIPTVKAGDNVSVHVKIKEGERPRICKAGQTFIRNRVFSQAEYFKRVKLLQALHSFISKPALKKLNFSGIPS